MLITIALGMFTTSMAQKVTADFSVVSRYIYRGVDLGKAGGLQADINYKPCKEFEAGIFGSTVLDGTSKLGYGSVFNTHAALSLKGLQLQATDLYFYDSTNPKDGHDYFTYSKDYTKHFIEAKIGYSDPSKSKLSVYASKVIYQQKDLNSDALYLEGAYNFTDAVCGTIGYCTKESAVNFTDRSGFTNIGLAVKRQLKISDALSCNCKVALTVNPNYEHIPALPQVGTKPVNLALSLTF